MHRYSVNYARSLVAASSDSQIVDPRKRRGRGLSRRQVSLMQRESRNLGRELGLVDKAYGCDSLDLVLARGYLDRLLSNGRVARHLALHHPDILREFQRIIDLDAAATGSAA
jgi:hypothetical protein